MHEARSSMRRTAVQSSDLAHLAEATRKKTVVEGSLMEERSKVKELIEEWPIVRRDLTLGMSHVDMRLYRRTRTSCDILRRPPEFVYHVQCDWSGEAMPRSPPPPRLWGDVSGGRPTSAGKSPRSPQSTKTNFSPRSQRPGSAGQVRGEGDVWWDTLPKRYVVKRRWVDIVRFHQALVDTLAYDPEAGCWRVKAKIPTLPTKGDLNSWTNGYAATGDACAMSRSLPIAPPSQLQCRDIQDSLSDLEGLHWRYCDLKLKPYFVEVNKVLLELPVEVLMNSVALRRFVLPGSAALRPRGLALQASGIQKRFLGPFSPLISPPEDVAAAYRLMQRVQSKGKGKGSGKLSQSAPSLLQNSNASKETKSPEKGGASTAAAKLVLSPKESSS